MIATRLSSSDARFMPPVRKSPTALESGLSRAPWAAAAILGAATVATWSVVSRSSCPWARARSRSIQAYTSSSLPERANWAACRVQAPRELSRATAALRPWTAAAAMSFAASACSALVIRSLVAWSVCSAWAALFR